MKHLWDKLGKGLTAVGLAEQVEETAETPQEAPKSAPTAPPAAVNIPAPPAQANAARMAEVDAAAHARLSQALGDAPLVKELNDNLETLADMIPDESQRYKAALKLLTKKGRSVTELLGDIDKSLGTLAENQRTFEADTNVELERRVGTKVKAIQDLERVLENKRAQLEALKNEITITSTTLEGERHGVTQEQAKIAQVKERFSFVYSNMKNIVESQRSKVAQYGESL